MPGRGGGYGPRPTKVLHGIPNHETYRWKLRAKWMRKGYTVEFR